MRDGIIIAWSIIFSTLIRDLQGSCFIPIRPHPTSDPLSHDIKPGIKCGLSVGSLATILIFRLLACSYYHHTSPAGRAVCAIFVFSSLLYIIAESKTGSTLRRASITRAGLAEISINSQPQPRKPQNASCLPPLGLRL